MRPPLLLVLFALFGFGCTARSAPIDVGTFARDAGNGTFVDASSHDAGEHAPDSQPVDAAVWLDPDAACASANVEVDPERMPVDIIWVVDNSNSMKPARDQVRAGLNAFAAQIAASDLDYRVILLSLRGRSDLDICIPPPLAGADCADGPRFFQVDVDIKSSQPIEQFLGTLAQSSGYTEDASIGSAPWRHLLREGATKTIVVVTDDNARTCARPHSGGRCYTSSGITPLTATSLEDYPGGPHPFAPPEDPPRRVLGPGILTATYGDLFAGYTFDAIYGWGSETDPDEPCTYPGGNQPDAPGHTYTTLVARTGGVRARICDGARAWGPFFDSVASAVVRNSRIACEVELPEPPDGSLLNPRRVNVVIRGESGSTTIPYTSSFDACDETRGGWYYDDAAEPTRVILCPTSCDFAREETQDTSGAFDVVFGCQSILI